MRRILWALVLLAGCAPAPHGTAAIGVVTSHSGDLSEYGEAVRRGVDLAVADAGGRVRAGSDLFEIHLAHRDDHGTAAGAAQGLRELAQEGVVAVIGPVSDRVAERAVRAADELSVPLVVPWVMDPAVLAGSGFAFSVGYSDAVQGAAMAAYAVAEHHASRAAVVTDGTAYAVRLLDGFRQAFARDGRRVVARALDDPSDAAVVAVAAPDVVFVAAAPSASLRIIARLRAAGVRAPILGGDVLVSPDVALLGGPDAEGVAFPTQWSPLDARQPSQAFESAYARRYGESPEVLAALGYDAARVILDALRAAGRPDREAVRDRLAAIAGVDLVTGRLWMGPAGTPDKEIAILALRNGQPRFVRRVTIRR